VIDHERAVESLPEYFAGRLGADACAELEEHLAECEECRDMAAAMRMIGAALGEDDGHPEHPTADEIVALALGERGMTASVRRRVEEHVETCSQCAAEIRRVRSVESSVPPMHALPRADAIAPRPKRRPRTRLALAAAALLVAALAYPVFLGVVRLPAIEERARRLEERAADHERRMQNGHVVQLQILRSPLREGSPTQSVRVNPRAPYVLLAIDAIVPESASPGARVRLQLLESGDDAVITADTPISEARSQLRSSGVLTWLLPSQDLRPGRYRLRASLLDGGESTVLFDIEFDATR
jgi:hypothetical protein